MSKRFRQEEIDDIIIKIHDIWYDHPEYTFGKLVQKILQQIKLTNITTVDDPTFEQALDLVVDIGFEGEMRRKK